MVFSSLVFVFGFLPFVLAGNFLLQKKRCLQNFFLLASSLFFYAWGEPRFVLIMLVSIVFNWGMARLLEVQKQWSRVILPLTILTDIGILFLFKYLNFSVSVLNKMFIQPIEIQQIALPIGISFFTFQGLSYVIDVWRKDIKAEKSIIHVGLYISFFPQLIAGPIVRFTDIRKELTDRIYQWADVQAGIYRFLIGFSKKVLLANNLAIFADQAFAYNLSGEVNTIFAWGGALAYTLQIYYDFSGYSDMAIGLGRMLGFHFSENFHYPYCADSVSDFWRRWHISLGSWFRDYVYIPLGGNRAGTGKWIRNLVIVWLLTGIWHGANYTFIIWGIFYGCIIIFEKLTKMPQAIKCKSGRAIYRAATLLLVIIAWVLFRAESISLAWNYLISMFSWKDGNGIGEALFYFSEFKYFFIAGIFCALPLLSDKIKKSPAAVLIQAVGLMAFFIVGISYLVKGSYNPFIYFNF